MKVVVWILQGLLGLAFLFFGWMKVSGSAMQVGAFGSYGYPLWTMYAVGLLEILGAIGLIVGFRKARLAFLSASLLAVVMIGAIFTHLQAGQGMGVAMTPLILLLLVLVVVFGYRPNSRLAGANKTA